MRIHSAAAFAALLLVACEQQSDDPAQAGIPIDADDIAGVVTSAAGPEAGVWVIAETDDLGARS